MQEAIKKADVLIEALPYLRKFRHKIFVLKYGGSILMEEKVRRSILEDLVFLFFAGIQVILVHGGGPEISRRLKENSIESEFHAGMRITSLKVLDIVRESLAYINQKLVKEIRSLGAKAKGIGGEEVIFAVKKKSARDLGWVGEAKALEKEKILSFLRRSHILVVSPLGRDGKNNLYNINADAAAAFLAKELAAEKIVLFTDVKGIMRKREDESSLISSITKSQIEALIKEGVIAQGMIPKVLAADFAVAGGVNKAHIIDAKIPHSLLLEIFTKRGIGTEIISETVKKGGSSEYK